MSLGKPSRKPLRLPSWDYRSVGACFITICCHGRQTFFAKPEVKAVVEETWYAIPQHFTRARLDEFVVMPNHVHGIVWLVDDSNAADPWAVGAQHAEPLRPGLRAGSLSAVVRSFKAAVTTEVRRAGLHDKYAPVWQRNFYERVIRNDDELNRIREYIRLNPARWLHDAENPAHSLDSAYECDWGRLEAKVVAFAPL